MPNFRNLKIKVFKVVVFGFIVICSLSRQTGLICYFI